MLGGLFFILPTMGAEPLLRAFVVVVFGGLGSLPGTIIGSYAIGLIEQSSAYVFSLYWAPVVSIRHLDSRTHIPSARPDGR